MTLKTGTRLGPYEITAPIGAGGMGEVYRATDTKLRREVAIKVLPEDFANDRERLARFEREAHLLASLNHPNIASIYGLEESDGKPCLVLELVEGETLAERIAAGALPVDQALSVAQQIASALEAAHEKGIVHRDLKPANVKVTAAGTVKVLDFGLAKALHGDSSVSQGSGLSHSPTVTAGGTREGVILGTAPYMSPEQARGKALDKRTDIWSFGCVLYECLTGKQMFRGETATDILSAILRAEPEWSDLPERTPPRVRELLQRCLEREFKNRLHDIGDARLEVEKAQAGREWATSGIAAAEIPALRQAWRRVGAVLVAGLLIGAIGGIGLWTLFSPKPSGEVSIRRLSIVAPDDQKFLWYDISQDDQHVLLTILEETSDGERVERLYRRPLDGYELIPIEGAEDKVCSSSVDGRWLACVGLTSEQSTQVKLLKISVDGSAPPLAIADWPGNMSGSTAWLPNGDIVGVTSSRPRSLIRFPMDGRAASAPVPIDADEYAYLRPSRALPDGRHVLTLGASYAQDRWQNDALLLDTETGQLRLLQRDASFASWTPNGHLLFTRADTLLAATFDLERLELTGAPEAVMRGIWTPNNWTGGRFGCSARGTLVYRPGSIGSTSRRLVVMDTEGRVEPWLDDRREFQGVRVSPDERSLAVAAATGKGGLSEIWVSDVQQPRLRLLVREPGMDCWSRVWSPDSKSLVYQCEGSGKEGVYIRRTDASGEPELLVERESDDSDDRPTSISPDGSTLLLKRHVSSKDRDSIWLLPLGPAPDGRRVQKSLLVGEPYLNSPVFSPDGGWVAYGSNETGRFEVYIRRIGPDGDLGSPVVVSSQGGNQPSWVDTPEAPTLQLQYNANDRIMAVSIVPGPEPIISEPRQVLDLVELNGFSPNHLRDGRWMLVQRGEDEEGAMHINVVQNFFEELKRHTPSAQ